METPSEEVEKVVPACEVTGRYGAPGVEFTALHKHTAAVTQITFLPAQGRLLSLLDDNSIHLWELVGGAPREVGGARREPTTGLQEVCSYSLPGRPGMENCSTSRVAVLLLLGSCDLLCVGTEGGGVHFLDLPRLSPRENQSVLQDQVIQSLPAEFRCGKSLGPVESLQEHPQQPGRILIGYSRGLVVQWDVSRRRVDHLFLGKQSFVSSHSDGGYSVWAVTSGNPYTQQPVSSTIPYGPFPCKAISKILLRTTSSGAPMLLYSGGMPRASYGDRHCLTIQQDKDHVTLDFTSRVVDFFTVHSAERTQEFDELWARLLQAGRAQRQAPAQAPPPRSWPICGGKNLAPPAQQQELLLTGHEDGTVRFWDACGVALTPLYKLSTAGVFHTDCDPPDDPQGPGGDPQGPGDDPDDPREDEDEWPPFRKVGCFDPYSDDPRLGIQKISLCKYSNKLVVGGTAGQVLILGLSEERSDHQVVVSVVDLLQDREGFTWKGHGRLVPRSRPGPFPPGFQPQLLVQCLPPAAVTAVTLHAEWHLVAFGTSHGFGLLDYRGGGSPVLSRCTLHPNDSLAMEGPLSRVKSLKKSLRQSFRRIRKSRVSGKKRPLPAATPSRCTPPCPPGTHHGPTLWAGTNSGSVYAYALEVPGEGSARGGRPRGGGGGVEAVLGKEIQLMHRAPVVWIGVLDGAGRPLPEPYEASRDLAAAPDMSNAHSVLIASEEQLKVFSLPKVSAKTKFKLTAHEGCRVRRAALVLLSSALQEDYSENTLVCLTNLGDIHLFTVPALRPQVRYDCIRKEDISGIASFVFTKTGQGFYLISPSEYERFSLSAKVLTEPLCSLQLDRPLENTSDGTTEQPRPNGTHRTTGEEILKSLRQTKSLPDLWEGNTDSPLDSPLSYADLTLDSTGELTVEDNTRLYGLTHTRPEHTPLRPHTHTPRTHASTASHTHAQNTRLYGLTHTRLYGLTHTRPEHTPLRPHTHTPLRPHTHTPLRPHPHAQNTRLYGLTHTRPEHTPLRPHTHTPLRPHPHAQNTRLYGLTHTRPEHTPLRPHTHTPLRPHTHTPLRPHPHAQNTHLYSLTHTRLYGLTPTRLYGLTPTRLYGLTHTPRTHASTASPTHASTASPTRPEHTPLQPHPHTPLRPHPHAQNTRLYSLTHTRLYGLTPTHLYGLTHTPRTHASTASPTHASTASPTHASTASPTRSEHTPLQPHPHTPLRPHTHTPLRPHPHAQNTRLYSLTHTRLYGLTHTLRTHASTASPTHASTASHPHASTASPTRPEHTPLRPHPHASTASHPHASTASPTRPEHTPLQPHPHTPLRPHTHTPLRPHPHAQNTRLYGLTPTRLYGLTPTRFYGLTHTPRTHASTASPTHASTASPTRSEHTPLQPHPHTPLRPHTHTPLRPHPHAQNTRLYSLTHTRLYGLTPTRLYGLTHTPRTHASTASPTRLYGLTPTRLYGLTHTLRTHASTASPTRLYGLTHTPLRPHTHTPLRPHPHAQNTRLYSLTHTRLYGLTPTHLYGLTHTPRTHASTASPTRLYGLTHTLRTHASTASPTHASTASHPHASTASPTRPEHTPTSGTTLQLLVVLSTAPWWWQLGPLSSSWSFSLLPPGGGSWDHSAAPGRSLYCPLVVAAGTTQQLLVVLSTAPWWWRLDT
ncbi:hypothetical protein NHX12_032033 [Muraenolepis orangiensis]|uniref:Lethal giant larvae homologue 2 domain-containing protein n=1 Tax=Muraenolepis orangiensis TaxID=630683 RepID=A0A9Q0IK87_9TELE|nr:hypothetical protein NHX12_032033 [Muraenolepis orangiensis]